MKILAFPAFNNRRSNPYNYLLNNALIDAGVNVDEFSFKKTLFTDYDLIHIHWPDWYLSNPSFFKAIVNSSLLLISITLAKLKRKKVVWTVHNLKPHAIKHPITSNIFWYAFKRLIDGTLSLSEANKQLFLNENEEFSSRTNAVTYHGLYVGVYENDITKNIALKKFDLDKNIKACLFLGQLKPYKNIEELISLFSNELSLKDRVLIIAGKFDSTEYREAIRSQIGSASNIKLFEGFVDDKDLQYFFSIAELTILPFKNIFNSGSALLSASFKVPVLVPWSNNFVEYANLLPGMIKTYQNELDGQTIISAMENLPAEFDLKTIDKLKWENIAKNTANFFHGVIND